MEALSKPEDFFAFTPTVERVPLPAIGRDVFVRALSVGERDALDESCYVGEGKDRHQDLSKFRTSLLRFALCKDESGAPVFSAKDDAAIARLSSEVFEPAFDAALRKSGMSVKAKEAIAGNSGAGQGAGASSTLPNVSG